MRNNRVLVVASIALATVLAMASGALAQPSWKHVGSLGQRQLVVVEPAAAADSDLLRKAAAAACVPGQPCVVAFWSDIAEVPSSIPMSATQQQAMVAQYIRNPVSGAEELLLKCASDDQAAGKCLR